MLLSAWTDLALSGGSWRTNEEKDFLVSRASTLEERQAYLGEQSASFLRGKKHLTKWQTLSIGESILLPHSAWEAGTLV
jgi:hypothetical protein